MASTVTQIEGTFETPQGARVGIVVSRFNHFITDRLLEGALDGLRRHGMEEGAIVIARTPGAFELPLVVRQLAASKKLDAVIALGAVIRGSTPHFDYVAGEASRGLMDAAREFDLPVGFGLLTCDDMAQAEARAGGGHGNKGWDAAVAALEMADLFARLDAGSDDEDAE